MYSQNGEDDVVVGFLDREYPGFVGTMLDIGANDGGTFSNSLLLIDRGWKCLCVDADPRSVSKLIERHGANPRVKVVSGAVTPGSVLDAMIPLHLSYDGLYSTPDEFNRAKWSKQMTGVSIAVARFSVVELLEEAGAFIDEPGILNADVLSVDIEGGSAAVFRDFAIGELEPHLRPKAVIVEHDGQWFELEAELAPLGYVLLARNAENIVMGRPA